MKPVALSMCNGLDLGGMESSEVGFLWTSMQIGWSRKMM